MSDEGRRKADKALAEARVADVLRVLLDGAQPWDMSEYVRQQESEEGPWKLQKGGIPLCERQIRRYIAAALARLADISAEDRGRLLNRHLAMRRSLYARAVAVGELRVALAILDSEAELLAMKDLDTQRRLEEIERRLTEQEARHGQPTARQYRA